MRKKLIITLISLFSAVMSYGYDSIHGDLCNNFREWITPIYIYNLFFCLAFMIMFLLLYKKHKEWMNMQIGSYCQYLKKHPILALVTCGIFYGIAVGLVSRVVWTYIPRNYYSVVEIIGMYASIIVFLILVTCGRFRNNVLLSESLVKYAFVTIISVLCANVIYMFLVELKVISVSPLRWVSLISYGLIGEDGPQPISSIISLWKWGLFYIGVLPFSLLLHWMSNTFLWIKRGMQSHTVE